MSGWTDTVPRWFLIVAAWVIYVGALAVLIVMTNANPSTWGPFLMALYLFGWMPPFFWTGTVVRKQLGYVLVERQQRKADRIARRKRQRATRSQYRRLKEAGIPTDKYLGYGSYSIRLSPQEARDRAIAERGREIAAINRQLDELGIDY